MENVGTIGLGFEFDGRGYKKQIKQFGDYGSNQLTNSFSHTFKSIGKMAVLAFSAKALTDFTASCLKLGSDLTEVQNVVDVAFPSMNQQVNSFAKNAMTQFGLSETIAKKYMGSFGAMSKAYGFTEKQSVKMSETLTSLVGDVSSFYNIDQQDAYSKLSAVFTSETEALKHLGVVMTQNALDEYALQNGYAKTTNAMTEKEKVALRLAFVTDQLNLASGDFVRTQDSWANQTRVLALRFDSLKASLGKGFIAMFSPIVKGINWVLASLQPLADSFSSLMEMLTGTSQSTSGGALVNTATELLDASNGADALSGGLTQAGKDGEKSAKKIDKAFAKIDTINKLTFGSDDDEDMPSSSAPGSSSSSPIDIKQAVDFPSATKQANALGDMFKPLIDILAKFGTISFDPLIKSLGLVGSALKPLASTVWDGLLWALDSVLLPLSKWTIEDVLPVFMKILSGALTILNPILKAFGDIFVVVWDNVLEPIASWGGGVIISVLNGIGDCLLTIGDWMNKNKGTVTTMTSLVLGFFGAWKLTELLGFIQMSGGLVGAFDKVKTAIVKNTIAKIADKKETMIATALNAKDLVKSLVASTGALVKQGAQWLMSTTAKGANTVATLAGTAATNVATAATWLFNAALTVLTSPITLVVLGITGLIAIICALVNNWDTVKQVASNVWDGIVGIWNSAGSWFSQNVSDPIMATFGNLWEGVKNAASGAWGFILGLFSNGGKIFNGVVGSIATVFKNIVNSIISGINSVIRAPFNTINNLLNSIRSFKILGMRPFSKMWGKNPLPVPQIPYLAEGAYVGANQPQLAMIGDNKRYGEIVAPENKLMDMVNTALKMQKDKGSSEGLGEVINLISKLIEAVNSLVLKVDIDMKKLSIALENAKRERQMIGG